MVNDLAKECEFMQRTRKITAYDLIESVLFSKFETDKLSLNDHCLYFMIQKGIIVKKQSVDKRFNDKAIVFIKRLLEQVLSEELSKSVSYPLLDAFSKVRIKDAVNFQLPEHLKSSYPGSGGAASKAMLKIQFEYDFLSRQILELDITPFTKSDSTNAKETIDNIKPGELVIRDLAYVSIDIIRMISEDKRAYYLNRLNTTTIAFYKEHGGKRIDFHQLESIMRKDKTELREFNVAIGEEKKYSVRMVVSLVSEKTKEKRIRKRKSYAKKKKQTVSKETLARCGLNIFITNVDNNILPIKSIVPIYGVRWQIENVFKVWKSVGGVNKVKKMSKARFEFYLYSKLLILIKTWQSMQLVEQITQVTISYYKYLKAISNLCWENIDLVAHKIVKSVGVEVFITKEFRNNRINEKSLNTILNSCISVL